MKPGLLSFISLLLVFSCNTQEVCDDNVQSELVVMFKTLESGSATDSIISGVTMHGIREGKPDSLLYDSSTTSKAILPLDPNHGFSRFVLNINEQSDTLRINHDIEFYLLNYTCGFAAMYTMDSILHSTTMIKKVEIINSVIDEELIQDEEHLWIYF